MPGVAALNAPQYIDEASAKAEIDLLNESLKKQDLNNLPLLVLCDDAGFTAKNLNNFVWVTFTRSNPATDISGINSFTEHKHWGCKGPLIIDARIKPHHAPPLVMDEKAEAKVDELAKKGGSLYGIV